MSRRLDAARILWEAIQTRRKGKPETFVWQSFSEEDLSQAEPADRLRAAAVAILVVTGFRISELLTLPLDCEVEEVRSGKPRFGIRYYKEKTVLQWRVRTSPVEWTYSYLKDIAGSTRAARCAGT